MPLNEMHGNEQSRQDMHRHVRATNEMARKVMPLTDMDGHCRNGKARTCDHRAGKGMAGKGKEGHAQETQWHAHTGTDTQ